MSELTVYFGDNLAILQEMPPDSVDLIYIDPPLNTGKIPVSKGSDTAPSNSGQRNTPTSLMTTSGFWSRD